MLSLLIGLAAIAAQPLTLSAEADTPEHAIRSFFQAVASDDEKAYLRLTSNHFYAFDAGKRFTGCELFDAVKSLHSSGIVLQWNLGPIDLHMRGSVAWAAWENHGAIGKAKAMEPMSWLESAALHRSGDRWTLDFLHSNRTEPPPPTKR
jgi:hypothetical protein